jgi:hypothetical protein
VSLEKGASLRVVVRRFEGHWLISGIETNRTIFGSEIQIRGALEALRMMIERDGGKLTTFEVLDAAAHAVSK